MNKFLFLKAANRKLYDLALTRLRESALDTLSFHPTRIQVKEFPQSLAFSACFQRNDSAGFNKHYVATHADRTFAFDGLPVFTGLNPARNWAEQLDYRWRSDEDALSSIFGTWAFLRFDRAGLRVLSDFTGMTPVFYWADDRYLAISPRQTLLANVCGQGQLDFEALTWLTGQANLIGDRMPYKGVKHLPPMWTLAATAVPSDLKFELRERHIWCENPSSSVDDAEMDGIAETLIAQCDAMASLPVPALRLDITGGLDSRVVTALAMNSRLRDKVEYLQTSGIDEDAHEVQVGRAVAEQLGVEHVVNIGRGRRQDPERIVELIKLGLFRFESSICPPDGLLGVAAASRLIFTGSAGEIYRRHCKPHMKVELKSASELIALFADYHQRTDPLMIERPELAESQRHQMQTLAQAYHDSGVPLNDVTDVFFLRYRLPLWNGIMMNNLYSGVRVYPLVNFAAAQYAFAKGYQARVQDRIHFEVLLRIAPRLCELPFLNFVWPQAYRELAARKGVNLPGEPFPVKGPRSVAQQSSPIHVMMAEGWPLVRSLILDGATPEFWELFAKDRVEAVLTHGPVEARGTVPGKQILALLAVLFAMNGEYITQREGRAVAPELDGSAATRLFGETEATALA